MKWIDVKKRKPEPFITVLLALRDAPDLYQTGYWSGETWSGHRDNISIDAHVAHWCPNSSIPTPPKVNRHARKKGAK